METSGIAAVGIDSDANWQDRVVRLLGQDAEFTLVVADRSTGVDLAIPHLGTLEAPLVWLRFDQLDVGDEVSQGSRLADAITRTIGSPLVGHGLPMGYGIQVLCKFHDLVGPFTFVVSNIHFAPTAVAAFAALRDCGSRVVFVSDDFLEPNGVAFSSTVSAQSLLLTDAEATELASALGCGEEVHEILRLSERRLVAFNVICRQRRSLPPLLIPQPAGATFEGQDLLDVAPTHLVDALLSRGAAAEALEYAVRTGSALPKRLINEAGQHFFGKGLYRRLFGLFSLISAVDRAQSDELMTWYFSAGTAIGEHGRLRVEIQRYLHEHEAPELRALFAAAFPGANMLAETRRALDHASTPITLRMYAFALGQTVGGETGAEYLMHALRQSEALGRNDLVMACATDLADYWAKRGAYADGIEWTKWALDWHRLHGLRDEVRRMGALSVYCHLRMLVGDTFGLNASLEEVDVSYAGIPTMESAVSTKADWHFLSGDFGTAADLYAINVEKASLGQYHHAVLDLVHCLVHLGKYDAARELAFRAHAMTRNTDAVDEAIGSLALGLAMCDRDPEDAIKHLEVAQGALLSGVLSTRMAQTSIALARNHFRGGNEALARAALDAGASALRELGFTGWTLLGGFDPEVKTLYQMFKGETTELELQFLGDERVILRGAKVELGLRQCECLVVLASRPSGVSAERLGDDVYGEHAHLSTLKAIVSRLRQAVPIDSRPYRIGVSTRADFIELERLLAAGRVREAMSLYRGPLLPRSDAPAVVQLRDQLEESIRRAVLRSGDVEALLQLAKLAEVDLELYEAALERLSPNDPRFPIVRARLERVRRTWEDK